MWPFGSKLQWVGNRIQIRARRRRTYLSRLLQNPIQNSRDNVEIFAYSTTYPISLEASRHCVWRWRRWYKGSVEKWSRTKCREVAWPKPTTIFRTWSQHRIIHIITPHVLATFGVRDTYNKRRRLVEGARRPIFQALKGFFVNPPINTLRLQWPTDYNFMITYCPTRSGLIGMYLNNLLTKFQNRSCRWYIPGSCVPFWGGRHLETLSLKLKLNSAA